MEILLKEWKLKCVRSDEAPMSLMNRSFEAAVPGDVTAELMKQGAIGDVQYADNCLKYRWINRAEWEYSASFDVSERMLKEELLYLDFEGIDTFSEIYVNDKPVGKTDNMFLPFRADIKAAAVPGKNVVRVRIKPTDENIPSQEGYFGAFRSDRLFVRKAQCHFGWDWAPEFYGTGIWRPVKLFAGSRRRIEYVRVRTRVSGEITFFPELGYCVRKEEYEKYASDRLRIRVFDCCVCVAFKEYPADGYKNLCNLSVPSPKLWYPNGYGGAHLYSYSVEIIDADGYTADRYTGTFGIREVRLDEAPIGESRLDFRAYINGRKIFLKGSNWVPASFMTGAVSEERYRRLLSLAKEAGFNVLRVWGGGVYESDLFYRLCDEYGLLVWHDFMFACGDIPDEKDEFCRSVSAEAVYQVRRLNNHPCMLLWNGGNEIKQSFAYSEHPKRGEYLIDFILAGICRKYTDVPYYGACPWSYTDFGNDLTSGDCHKCAVFDASTSGRIGRFREYIVKDKPIATETAMLGPCRIRSLKKFIPEEKLWPINEIWDLHFVDNPYEPKLPPSFARLEKMIAESFFGGVTGLGDFVKKAMLSHADVLTAEIDFARADCAVCGGILNWMYNDIWRNGTWSVVDYELCCKPAYYVMKRAFSPVRAGVLLRKEYRAFAANDTDSPVKGVLRFGCRRVSGETLFSEEREAEIPVGGAVEFAFSEAPSDETDVYLFAELNGIKTFCFANGYEGAKFESKITVAVSEPKFDGGRYAAKCKIKAAAFAKAVFLDAAEEFDFFAEDNYFDMEAGDEREVSISCSRPFTQSDIAFRTFADEWED